MCDCRFCGAFSDCGDPSCTNSECPECEALRDAHEAESPELPEPDVECLVADGEGRR